MINTIRQTTWNLSSSVEMKASQIRREHDETEVEVATFEASNITQSSKLCYDIDSFVAVIGDNRDTSVELWVGRIIDKIKNSDKSLKMLKVHWYEPYGDGDGITKKFRPWFVTNKVTKRKKQPWFGTVTCDSVLNSFPTLTSQRILPISVANDIRERLPS